MKLITYISTLSILCTPLLAYADEDDTRLLLDDSKKNLQQYQQSQWLQQQNTEGMQLTIDGQTYSVGKTLEELELAIYYALNLKQWSQLELFIAEYQLLAEHKKQLLFMAEGLLAREKGIYALAIKKLQQARQVANKQIDNDNVRLFLELARLYAEDNQNKEAQQLFEQILQTELPDDTREIVQGYIHNIQLRNNTHGSISLGLGYNDNINQGNGDVSCVQEIEGFCLMTRQLPQELPSSLLNYNFVLSKKIPLISNHNILLRPLSYGAVYQQQDNDNPLFKSLTDNTTILYAGYNYSDVSNNVSILPYFEHYYRNHKSNHQAYGVDISWDKSYNQHWSISSNAGIKRFHYQRGLKDLFTDYNLGNLGISLSYQFSPSASIYSGIDFNRKKSSFAHGSSKDYVFRLGGFKLFANGVYINGVAIHRNSRYDGKTFMDQQRRHDKQNIAIVSLGASHLSYQGFYPELRFRRTYNKSSNIFYTYNQNELSLNLRKNF